MDGNLGNLVDIQGNLVDIQDLKLICGFIESWLEVTILACDFSPNYLHRPHFFLPSPGSRAQFILGFLNLPCDTNPFKPALSYGFGFFHELFGGANHLPIARADSFHLGEPIRSCAAGFVECSGSVLWNSAFLVGPQLLASPLH